MKSITLNQDNYMNTVMTAMMAALAGSPDFSHINSPLRDDANKLVRFASEQGWTAEYLQVLTKGIVLNEQDEECDHPIEEMARQSSKALGIDKICPAEKVYVNDEEKVKIFYDLHPSRDDERILTLQGEEKDKFLKGMRFPKDKWTDVPFLDNTIIEPVQDGETISKCRLSYNGITDTLYLVFTEGDESSYLHMEFLENN